MLFGSFATTNAYLDVFVAKLAPCFPVLQITNGDVSDPADTSAITVVWPISQTGNANCSVECSTNCTTWAPANELETSMGGGQYSVVISKLGGSTYYRLKLSN